MSKKKAPVYRVVSGFETADKRWEPEDVDDLSALTAAQVKWAVSKGLVEVV